MSVRSFSSSESQRFSSDDDDSSSSDSSYSSHSSYSSSSPRSLSPREFIPFLKVRQRRRPASSVSMPVNARQDHSPHETLHNDKGQHRGIHKSMHWSSWFLAMAITIWLMVHAWENYMYWYINTANTSLADDIPSLPPPRRIRPSKNFLMTDTMHDNNIGNRSNYFANQPPRRRKNVEDMPDGCRLPYDWQRTSFPDCNRVHEIDLKQHLHFRQVSSQLLNSTEYYIRSGLWRDVFSIQPDGKTPVVIKLMKEEHDVDDRNLDRHRRDALTMERLTASPNVVDIYGFCGNTVLTEQAPMGLDQRVKQGGISIHQAIEWALGAAKGVAALHSLDIIHADIQTQQFLLNEKGIVKINDFNRCRFLPRNNTSLEICPIGIPSAPGLWRSPEEYNEQLLVQAMDVYSLGNVIHELLVGHRPFHGLGANQAKSNIRHGVRPTIATNNDLSQRLADLIYACLEGDVDKRIQADKLVRELEALIALSKSKHSEEQ